MFVDLLVSLYCLDRGLVLGRPPNLVMSYLTLLLVEVPANAVQRTVRSQRYRTLISQSYASFIEHMIALCLGIISSTVSNHLLVP